MPSTLKLGAYVQYSLGNAQMFIIEGCEHNAKDLYRYNSEKGILSRQIRSIQTEGHLGNIKENDNFRRFNHRSEDKVYKEFMLYAIRRNINKYYRFLYDKLQKFEGKKEEKVV